MKTVLLLGARTIDPMVVESATSSVRTTLSAIRPECVLSDLAPGWGEIALNQSLRLGIPVVGAMPFPSPLLNQYRRQLRSSVVFSDSMKGFFENPKPYIEWLGEHADGAVTYFLADDSSFFHRLVITLGIERHDLHQQRRYR